MPTYDLEEKYASSRGISHLRSRCSRANKSAENPLKTAFPEFLFIRLPDIITYALAAPSVTEGFRVVRHHVTEAPDDGFCLTLFRNCENRIGAGSGDSTQRVILHMLSRNCINRIVSEAVSLLTKAAPGFNGRVT